MKQKRCNSNHITPWIEENIFVLKQLESLFHPYTKQIEKDEVLFYEGDITRKVYIVKSGRLRYSVFSESGQEYHFMIGKPGSMFADVSCFDQKPESANLTTIVDSELYIVPKEVIMNEFMKNHAFQEIFMKSISKKYRLIESILSDYITEKASDRVIKQLINLSEAHGVSEGSEIKIDIIFTHEDLANITYLSRVSVSNIMSSLSKKGLICKKGSYIYIRNIASLKELILF